MRSTYSKVVADEQPPPLTDSALASLAALDAVESLEIPDDLQQALEKLPPARTNFDRFPRSAKRAILEWISNAKRIETRTARIAETAEMAARNLRANQPRQVKSARS